MRQFSDSFKTQLNNLYSGQKNEGAKSTSKQMDLVNKITQAKKDTANALTQMPKSTSNEPKQEIGFWDRVGSAVSGAAKQYGGSVAATGAWAHELGTQPDTTLKDDYQTKYNRAKYAYDMMVSENTAKPGTWSQSDLDSTMNVMKDAESKLASFKPVQNTAKAEEIKNRLWATAARLTESGSLDIAQAKQGLGTMGKFAVDVGVGLGQLGADIGIGLATGGAAIPMAARSFGGGALEARSEGATLGQQGAYGALSAATELLTEKIASVGKINTKAFGAGAMDDILDGVVSRVEDLGKTDAGRAMLNRIASAGTGFISEGAEEAISAVVNPFLQKATYSKEPIDLKALGSEVANSFFVGGAIGAITGGVGGTDTTKAKANIAESKQSVNTPAAATSQAVVVEATQSKADTQTVEKAVQQAQNADYGKPTETKTATVLDIGTTAYVQLGMKPKRAEAKAKVVQKLINGEQVSLDGMKSLNLTDAKYRAVFTQLTGVVFPEGMTNHDQLMNVAKTASEVRNNAAAEEAPVVPMAEAQEDIAQDIPQTEATVSGEMVDEETMFPSYEEFASIQRTRYPELTDEELRGQYEQFSAREQDTVNNAFGQPVTRAQWRKEAMRTNPGATAEMADAYFDEMRAAEQQAAEKAVPVEDAGVGTTKTGGKGLYRDAKNEYQKVDKKTQKLLDEIGKRLGITVVLDSGLKIQSGDKKGEAARGHYSHETRTLRINPELGVSAVRTFRHELTHYIQDSKPEVYEKLVNVVKNHKQYDSIRAEVAERYEGVESDEARIMDEVMAEYAEQMCTDEQFIELLAKTDRNLFEILRDAITEFFYKLKGIDPGLDAEVEQIKKLWADALKAAEKSNSAVIHGKESFTVDGGRYSYKSMSHDIREGTMYADLTNPETLDLLGMKKSDIDKLFRQLNSLLKYMEPNLKVIDYNEEYGRDDRPYHPYKPNSDPLYKISLDFSTMCTKRLLTQHIVERLQVMEKKPMSAARQMAVREKIKQYAEIEKGLQVACAMCYVESARLHSPEQVQHYLDNPGKIVAKHFSFKNKEFNAAVKEMQTEIKRRHGFNPNASKGQMNKAAKDEFRVRTDEMRENYKPSTEEQVIVDTANALPPETYLTAENLAILSRQHPEIYDAFTTYIRNATRSKSTQTPVPYYYGDSKRGDTKVSDAFIEGVNAENGMRFSSWSDYMFKHVLDMMTAVIEMSVRGSSMHGYTKFPQQVRVFGKTGMMFNLSGVADGMGLDENGRLIFSDTESVNVLEARKVRNQYPETAGMQCIGVSDEHIRKLMATDWIDYIIPYHVSGMSAALRRLAGISGWKDYSDVQHAKEDPEAKKTGDPKWHKEPVFSEFFVTDNPGDGLDCMRRSAERYKQLCRERGLIPKFNDFASEPNYWKLLIDRKMINQRTGALIFQKPVKPIFNFREIRKQVREEVANYDPQREQRVFDYIVANMDDVNAIAADVQAEMNAGTKGVKAKAAELGNEMTATAVNGDGRYAVDSSSFAKKTSYGTLVAKPDMLLTEIDDSVVYKPDSKTRKQLVRDAIANAKQIGSVNSTGGVSVRVADLGDDVVLSTHGLSHGLDRRLQQNAAVTLKAAEIIQNAILINKLLPRKENVSGTYVLLGAAKNRENGIYVVEFVVNQHDNSVASVNVLYSANAKKELAVQNAPAITDNPLRITNSNISIAELLDLARAKFPDVLPESVLRHFGFTERPDGVLGESTLYAIGGEEETYLDGVKPFSLDDYTIDDILNWSDEELDRAYRELGMDPSFTLDDDVLLDDDFSIDSFSEELDVEPEVLKILFHRKGLGASHVEADRMAVMTQARIDQRIKEHGASQADYARRYITRISPKDFIDMTVYEHNMDREKFDSNVSGDLGSKMNDWDYEKQLRDSEEPPVLIVDKSTGQIIGHNGRHRVRALELAGIESVEIEVQFHDEDGYMIKYGAETIPDLAVSSQFDTAIETHLSNIIPLNKAHRAEIMENYGETAHGDAWVRYAVDSDDVKLREDFIKEFDAKFGEGAAEKMYKTAESMRRAAKRAEVRTKSVEESAAVERTLAKKATEDAITAWNIYHKKTLREKQRKYQEEKSKLYKAKAEAVADAIQTERAKADIRVQATEMNKGKHAAERERQLQERMMSEKAKAAERLRVEKDVYQADKQNRSKLQRNAAKSLIRDQKAVEKRRAQVEAEQGMVDTLRKNPRERTKTEKLREQASALRTLGRSFYHNFVNQANVIDRFAKRQRGGFYASSLVNLLGGCGSTTERIFKEGLVDRSGNRIGESLKTVLLCMDVNGKKVDEAKQALLQDYMLHQHNVDRMSFVSNAHKALDDFGSQHTWLVNLSTDELAKLVAATDAEVADSNRIKGKKGWTEADREVARQYHALLENYLEAEDKPVFGDSNGNPATAETSREIVAKYEAEHPWLVDKANGVYTWWDTFMRTWAVGDSLSQEEYERMRQTYPHYVPTYRVEKGGVGGAVHVGGTSASVSKATQKAKGSMLEIAKIEDSFANIASKVIRLARNNELFMNIIDTAMMDEEGIFSDLAVFDWDWQDGAYENALRTQAILNGETQSEIEESAKAGLNLDNGTYRLTGWKGGRKYSAILSKDLFQSISDITGHSVNDFERTVLKVGNALTGPMKTAITGINPFFAVRNLSRDIPSAIINSTGGKFPKYWAQALAEMKSNSDNWQVFQSLGGTNAGYYNNEKGFADAMSRGPGIVASAVDKLGAINNVTEAATRFAEYLSTIDRMGDTYEARVQGIKNSAEVTVDFSRKGRYGRVINTYVPYWNPAVQGIDKLVRSVVESPKGAPVWKQAVKTGSRAVMCTVLWEAVLQAVLRGLDRDDEWEELTDRDKAQYYCIPLPGEHKFLKIAKNREWGAILGTPFMLMLEGLDGRPDPFRNYVETSLEPNFMPGAILRPREGGGFTSDIIGVSQALDLAYNEDFAGRTIVPYAQQQGSVSEQYDSETSMVARALGELFNFSPMQIDYIIQDYFGDFGDLFTGLTAPGTYTDVTPEQVVENVWDTFTKSFWVDNRYSNQAVSDYYDTLDELGKVVNDKKNQMGSEAYKETKEYKTQKALQEMYGNQISDLNKEVRGLPDGEEKDAAKEQIKSLAGQALEFYKECMSGEVQEPHLVAEYANLPSAVGNELIRLKGFNADYDFEPTDYKPSKYTDPDDKKREYVLDADDKDQYRSTYNRVYSEVMQETMSTSKYQKASDLDKVEMLEEARDSVTELTKDEFLAWLASTRRSTEKSK